MAIARKMIDHFDVWFVGEFFGFGGIGFEVIGTAQVVQMIQRQPGIGLQKPGDFQNGRGSHFHPRIGGFQIGPADFGFAELVKEQFMDFGGVHLMLLNENS